MSSCPQPCRHLTSSPRFHSAASCEESDWLGVTSDDNAPPASQASRFLAQNWLELKTNPIIFPFSPQRRGSSLIVAIGASQTHSFVNLEEGLSSHQTVPDAVLIHGLSFWKVQRTTLEIRNTLPKHRHTRSLKMGGGWFKLWIPK